MPSSPSISSPPVQPQPSPVGCGKRKSDELAAAAMLMAAAATPTAREAGHTLSSMKGFSSSATTAAAGTDAGASSSSSFFGESPGMEGSGNGGFYSSISGSSTTSSSRYGNNGDLDTVRARLGLPSPTPMNASDVPGATPSAPAASSNSGGRGGGGMSGPMSLSIINPDDMNVDRCSKADGARGDDDDEEEDPETPWARDVAAFALPNLAASGATASASTTGSAASGTTTAADGTAAAAGGAGTDGTAGEEARSALHEGVLRGSLPQVRKAIADLELAAAAAAASTGTTASSSSSATTSSANTNVEPPSPMSPPRPQLPSAKGSPRSSSYFSQQKSSSALQVRPNEFFFFRENVAGALRCSLLFLMTLYFFASFEEPRGTCYCQMTHSFCSMCIHYSPITILNTFPPSF